MKYPWLPEEEIEARARTLLERTFGGTLDRSRAIELEEVLIYLSETDGLSYNLDATLTDQRGALVLGQTLPLSRKILLSADLRRDTDQGRARFTLAHEIGHWVLHRPLHVAWAQQGSLFSQFEEGAGFVGLSGGIFPASSSLSAVPREEWQANRFAVALLIDADVLRVEFARRFGAPQIARRSSGWRLPAGSLREHSRRLASASVDDLPPIRELFGVSIEAMAIALETRGYAVDEVPAL